MWHRGVLVEVWLRKVSHVKSHLPHFGLGRSPAEDVDYRYAALKCPRRAQAREDCLPFPRLEQKVRSEFLTFGLDFDKIGSGRQKL